MLKNPPDVPEKDETRVTIEVFYHRNQKGATTGDQNGDSRENKTRLPRGKDYTST